MIFGSVGVNVDEEGILIDIIGIVTDVLVGFKLLLGICWVLFFFILVLLLVE